MVVRDFRGEEVMRILVASLAALALAACASVQPGSPALTTAGQVESQTKFKEEMSGVVTAKGPTMTANGKTWLVSGTRGLDGAWSYKLELASDVSGVKEATDGTGATLHAAPMGRAGTSCRAYAKNCRVDEMVAVKLDDKSIAAAKTSGLNVTLKGDGGSMSASAPSYYLQGFLDAVEAYDTTNPGKSIDLF